MSDTFITRFFTMLQSIWNLLMNNPLLKLMISLVFVGAIITLFFGFLRRKV